MPGVWKMKTKTFFFWMPKLNKPPDKFPDKPPCLEVTLWDTQFLLFPKRGDVYLKKVLLGPKGLSKILIICDNGWNAVAI